MLKVSDMPNNGSAMLAIFCDLSPEDQSQFRPWLLEDMFPARLKIGYRNCASFDLVKGEGPEFVTLYETSSLGHLYDVPYRALRELRTPRDAAYHKKFQNPERYTLAWTGPEIARKTDDFATYIKIDRFNLKNHLIEEFNTWFFSTYISAFVRSVKTLSYGDTFLSKDPITILLYMKLSTLKFHKLTNIWGTKLNLEQISLGFIRKLSKALRE